MKNVSIPVFAGLAATFCVACSVGVKADKNAANAEYIYTKLTVTNSSAKNLTDLRYSGGEAEYSGSTVNPVNPYRGKTVTILKPGETCTFSIENDEAKDHLHFKVNGKETRTEDFISISKGKKKNYTINDNTLVKGDGEATIPLNKL